MEYGLSLLLRLQRVGGIMSENIISWTPCKVKYPPEAGSYFVTVKHPVNDFVIVRCFPHEEWTRSDFIAWAEMPKPYDKRRTKNVKVKWHPYPEDRPVDLLRYYLVTDIFNKKREVSMYFWYNLKNKFLEEDIAPVIAWAEMPEPYKGES